MLARQWFPAGLEITLDKAPLVVARYISIRWRTRKPDQYTFSESDICVANLIGVQ